MEFTYKDGSTPIKVTISKIEANSFSVSLIDRTHEGIPWRLLHNHMMENSLYEEAGLPENAKTNWEKDSSRSNENLRTIIVCFGEPE
jgi:hypothetical protein